MSTIFVEPPQQLFATRIQFTIFGEPASKANSREIVVRGGRPASIKSEKALAFEADALRQIPPKFRLQLSMELRIDLNVFYASERPDLDESLLLDVLQDRYAKRTLTARQKEMGVVPERYLVQRGVYINDRQIREKHIYHFIDRSNPRTEILIQPRVHQNELGF